MPLDHYIQPMLPAIEAEMQQIVDRANGPEFDELHHMLAYALGWEGDGAGEKARGKRVRPLLLLLTTAAAGGDWQMALPAAAAVELIHNFSLIHDDIQDDSPLRRGRTTVWKKWDLPLAINAGDSMFALAHMALDRLSQCVAPKIALQAARLLPQTSLTLTQGQYLDLAYERRGDLTLASYWPMVSGKTAALLAACTELGALIAGVERAKCEGYRQFGYHLGLAFQVQDDILGIWGDSAQTGKSVHSDLLSGKKSLPVLYALEQDRQFAARWARGPITPHEVPELALQLEAEGARSYAQHTVDKLTKQALGALESAQPVDHQAKGALIALAHQLTHRLG